MAITLNQIMEKAFTNSFRKPFGNDGKSSDAANDEDKGKALFDTLAAAYREMTGQSGEVKATALFKWYQDTYDVGKSKKGNHRSVNPDDDRDEYCFDWVYKKDSIKYLNGEENDPPADFIIHMAIAFKLKPDELDKLLKDYGYLPLHVRNLHHLAIYAVLSKCDRKDNRYEQFNTVKEWYFEALEICKAEKTEEKATEKPASEERNEEGDTVHELPGLTQGLQDELKELYQLQGIVEKAQFLTFVKDHYALFRQRHSAILNEHTRLASVLSELNRRGGKGYGKCWTEAICWDIDKIKDSEICQPNVVEEGDNRCKYCPEQDLKTYNFECFVEHFCKEMKQKDFRSHLKTHIHGKKTHHPSRECMILLWLFAEIYRNHEPISYPPNYRDYVLGKNENNENEKFFGDKFDIAQYLFGRAADPNGSKRIWNGADVKRTINKELGAHDWGMLNQKLPFDRMIMCFLEFNIEKADENRIAVTLNGMSEKYIEGESMGYRVASGERNVEKRNKEVPTPLWLLIEFALFTRKFMKKVEYTSWADLKREKLDDLDFPKFKKYKEGREYYPFMCNLYEQTI